jgi:uncharacterized membrane protein
LLQKKSSIYIVLCTLLLIGIGLRFYKLDAFGLGGDEKYALLVSNFIYQEGGGQNQILRNESEKYFTNKQLVPPSSFGDFQLAIASRDNGSGATYDLLLHNWIKLFGVSDFSLRSLSVLFNMLTVLLLFIFTKSWTSNYKLALLVAFLAAVSPFYVAVSQVSRGYSLLFLLALLTTHLLLLYYHNRKVVYMVLYSIATFLTLQTHYSIFPLFFIHGLYVLTFHRKIKPIMAFGLAMIPPFVGMLAWFGSAGGQWALHSVEQSAVAYNKMAVTEPYEWLRVSTLTSVANQLWRAFTLTFPVFHNIGESLFGVKNFVLSILVSGLITFAFTVKSVDSFVKIGAISFLLIGQYLLTTVQPLHFMLFTLLITLALLLLTKATCIKNKMLILSIVIAILSHVFLVIFAFQDGNTMRILPRYSGYGYAFSCVAVGVAIYYLRNHNRVVKFTILLVLSFATLNYVQIFRSIFVDRPANYFHQFPDKRIPNPYYTLAETISETYVKGDTLILPSAVIDTKYGGFEIAEYSVQDAQYLNIYLSRKEPEIIQRIDRSEPNKVILKHADGTSEILFDFEGTKYRY